MSLLAVSLSALSAAVPPQTPPKSPLADISLVVDCFCFELHQQSKSLEFMEYFPHLAAKDFFNDLARNAKSENACIFIASLGLLAHEQVYGALQPYDVDVMLKSFEGLSDDERIDVVNVAGQYIVKFCKAVKKFKTYATYLAIKRRLLRLPLD